MAASIIVHPTLLPVHANNEQALLLQSGALELKLTNLVSRIITIIADRSGIGKLHENKDHHGRLRLIDSNRRWFAPP